MLLAKDKITCFNTCCGTDGEMKAMILQNDRCSSFSPITHIKFKISLFWANQFLTIYKMAITSCDVISVWTSVIKSLIHV